jgi:hypothetical protein
MDSSGMLDNHAGKRLGMDGVNIGVLKAYTHVHQTYYKKNPLCSTTFFNIRVFELFYIVK